MDREKTIKGAGFQMDYLAEHTVKRCEADGYECQKLSFEDKGNPGLLIQIRNTSDGSWGKAKSLMGLKTCATLKLQRRGDDLEISVLAGQWLDKVAVNVVSWVILWPLFVTSCVGMWRQKKMLDQLFVDTLSFFAGA